MELSSLKYYASIPNNIRKRLVDKWPDGCSYMGLNLNKNIIENWLSIAAYVMEIGKLIKDSPETSEGFENSFSVLEGVNIYFGYLAKEDRFVSAWEMTTKGRKIVLSFQIDKVTLEPCDYYFYKYLDNFFPTSYKDLLKKNPNLVSLQC